MKKKEDKKKDVEALRKDLELSKNLFVTGYEKLRVESGFRAAQDASAARAANTAWSRTISRRRRPKARPRSRS